VRFVLISFIVISTLMLNLVIATFTSRMAEQRGYDKRAGFLAGLLLGVLAPPLLLALPLKQDATAAEADSHCGRCRARVRSYEGFCTVCGSKVEPAGRP
jgi:hypothetical protein